MLSIILSLWVFWASLVAHMVKNLPAMWTELRETWVQSLDGDTPLEKEMATNPVLLPEFHGQRRLVGYSPWCHKAFYLCRHSWGHFCTSHRSSQVSSLEPPLWLPRDKGSCLPREANGCKVWVPMPRRLLPLLEGKVVISTWGQTFLKREQHLLGWALTQQAFSSHSMGPSTFPPASITFLHLIPYPGTFSEDSLQTENPGVLNIPSICHVMESTMLPVFWVRKHAHSNSEIWSIWTKGEVC